MCQEVADTSKIMKNGNERTMSISWLSCSKVCLTYPCADLNTTLIQRKTEHSDEYSVKSRLRNNCVFAEFQFLIIH